MSKFAGNWRSQLFVRGVDFRGVAFILARLAESFFRDVMTLNFLKAKVPKSTPRIAREDVGRLEPTEAPLGFYGDGGLRLESRYACSLISLTCYAAGK